VVEKEFEKLIPPIFRRFPWNISYFLTISQSPGEMDLKVRLIEPGRGPPMRPSIQWVLGLTTISGELAPTYGAAIVSNPNYADPSILDPC